MDELELQSVTTFPQIAKMLVDHEGKSQKRYERLMDEVYKAHQQGEMKMGDGINTDKVNVYTGGGEGGAGAMAALVAALGNRNEGGDTAGLIAALGNRNDGMSAMLPALMAGGMNNGMNNLWPIILLALLGRGRGGGLFGGDDCGGGAGAAALLQSLMEGQSDLRAQVPTTALETQTALQNAIAQLALGTQQGFANTKDSIQNGIAFLDRDIQNVNQNVSAQGCQTREAVQNDGDKTRALLVARFQQEDATRIAELNAEVIELRSRGDHDRRHAESNLIIQNTNTAVANQQQQQQIRDEDKRHHELLAALVAIGNSVQVQRNRSEQDIINLGTMLASGTQTPTTTQVNR